MIWLLFDRIMAKFGDNNMSKKLRLIKSTIYVRHDQFNELEGTDFDGLQLALKNIVSKNGKGKDCVSIVRVLPTLASENTADVELVAFNEDIDFIEETDMEDEVTEIIDSFLDIELGHVLIKQSTDPFVVFGDLN